MAKDVWERLAEVERLFEEALEAVERRHRDVTPGGGESPDEDAWAAFLQSHPELRDVLAG